MNPADLTAVPDEKEVKQYISIFTSLDWMTALKGLATLILGLVVVRLIVHLVEKGLKHSHIPESVHSMIRTLLRILLDLVVFLSAASVIGIPITSFITLLGLAGLAVSLALQGVLENFAGGIILLSSQPFRIGDVVETDSISGTVKDIRLMNTLLESFDGKNIYIPNSRLYNSRIINYTQNGKRRIDLSISASYDNPPSQVRGALLSAVRDTAGVLEDPAPAVLTEEYADSAIRYTLRVWCSAEDFLAVQYSLNEKIYDAFASHGVVMTYPHLNVHMQPDSPDESLR